MRIILDFNEKAPTPAKQRIMEGFDLVETDGKTITFYSNERYISKSISYSIEIIKNITIQKEGTQCRDMKSNSLKELNF